MRTCLFRYERASPVLIIYGTFILFWILEVINLETRANEIGKTRVFSITILILNCSVPLDVVVNTGYSANLQASQETEATELFNNAYQTSSLTTANFGYAG
jgi:hypothetical protein